MKTLFVFLGDPPAVAQRCEAALTAADACWNHFSGVWVLRSRYGPAWWRQRLQSVAAMPEFQFLVIESHGTKADGVLTDWTWLEQHKI